MTKDNVYTKSQKAQSHQVSQSFDYMKRSSRDAPLKTQKGSVTGGKSKIFGHSSIQSRFKEKNGLVSDKKSRVNGSQE